MKPTQATEAAEAADALRAKLAALGPGARLDAASMASLEASLPKLTPFLRKVLSKMHPPTLDQLVREAESLLPELKSTSGWFGGASSKETTPEWIERARARIVLTGAPAIGAPTLAAMLLTAAAPTPTDAAAAALDKLLRGKRVAVIGPAGYLERCNMEPLLRDIDVVVRPNCKVDVAAGKLLLPPRTTARCDVVYHAGVAPGELQSAGPRQVRTPAGSAVGNESLAIYAAHGVQAVVWAQFHSDRLANYAWAQHSEWARNGSLSVTRTIPGGAAQQHFRTGVRTLVDVLAHKPASLLLLGYDFYQTPQRGFEGYYSDLPGVHPQMQGNARTHDTQREIRFFAEELLAKHPELHVDAVLGDLLQTRGFNVNVAQKVVADCTPFGSVPYLPLWGNGQNDYTPERLLTDRMVQLGYSATGRERQWMGNASSAPGQGPRASADP